MGRMLNCGWVPVRRRLVLGLTGWGVLIVMVGCSAGDGLEPGSTTKGSSSPDPSDSVGASPQASATVVEWRPASEVSLDPDHPSRGITQTTSQGELVTVSGATLTVPEGSITEPTTTNDSGLEETIIRLPEVEDGLPALIVSYVSDLGRSLKTEVYTQELLLIGAGRTNTYIERTPEEWSTASGDPLEAYLMTWKRHVDATDGRSLTRDAAGLWISDGATGCWTVFAHAPEDGLKQGSELWNALLSVSVESIR